MPKPSLQKNISGTIHPIARDGDKGVHIFLNGISLKVNVIARLKFELAYYKVTAHHVVK